MTGSDSFDHDLGAFVSIGIGSVSEDGTVIASDPGVGIIKAGWHCGGNPAVTGTPHDCPECQVCDGSSCVPGCALVAVEEVDPAQSTFAQVLDCSCDDRNPCTVEDSCDGGTCKGRPIEIDGVAITMNGEPGPLELPLLGTSTEEVTFSAQVLPPDNGCSEFRYFWQFQDGGFEEGQTVIHRFRRVGQFVPTVSVRCIQCPAVNTSESTAVEVFELAMLLEQVGDTQISSDGKYTEDTTVRVTAVRADSGEPFTKFTGAVEIMETGNTEFYKENDGNLPSTVQIAAGGTTTFVAKSQAGPADGNAFPFGPAAIEVSSHPMFGGAFEIDQWIDNEQVDPRSQGSVPDWFEARMRDLFDSLGGTGAVGEALATITGYKVASLSSTAQTEFTRSADHTTEIDLSRLPQARVPGMKAQQKCSSDLREALTVVMLHEARHGYQDLLGTLDLGAPDEFAGRPNNDDDQDWLVDVVPACTQRSEIDPPNA